MHKLCEVTLEYVQCQFCKDKYHPIAKHRWRCKEQFHSLRIYNSYLITTMTITAVIVVMIKGLI